MEIAREKYVTYAKRKRTSTNTVTHFWGLKMVFRCGVVCRVHFRSRTLLLRGIDVWRFLASFAKVWIALGYSFDEGWGQSADVVICYLLIVTLRRDRNVRWILMEMMTTVLRYYVPWFLYRLADILVFPFDCLINRKWIVHFSKNMMDQQIIFHKDLHVSTKVLHIFVCWNFYLWRLPFYWNLRAYITYKMYYLNYYEQITQIIVKFQYSRFERSLLIIIM